MENLEKISAQKSALKTLNNSIKRGMDLFLVAATAPLTLPAMLLVARAVKRDSEGPALFTQERIGLNGETFKIYKFRSMFVDKENEKPSNHIATEDDPRITKVGKFIRKYHLDELPQLWNVVKGDMSLVGPRPHPIEHAEKFRQHHENYDDRHHVIPGITGPEQATSKVRTLGNDEAQEIKRRVDMDLKYADNNNVFLDVAIIAKTAYKIGKDIAYHIGNSVWNYMTKPRKEAPQDITPQKTIAGPETLAINEKPKGPYIPQQVNKPEYVKLIEIQTKQSRGPNTHNGKF